MISTVDSWYAIATPHEDIRKGQLAEAIFAANLWAVAQGSAPDVYLDAEAFFQKSYLTGGLKNVLTKVGAGLSGKSDSGDRIISLQTSFGGGKTHILIALWHLAKHIETIRKSAETKELRAAIGKRLPEQACNVAVFTNQTCDATQGRTTKDGVHTWTLWGELAYQLGGKALYQKIADNDKARTVPQGLFADILREASPCLILIDELADYCVGASAVTIGDTTLADQTISFVQQLTEAVQQVKGAVVVATLPASHLEVASSEKGQEILERLEKRFGRVGADVKPVSDEEIYEVVRRRLFENLGTEAEHETVASAYMAMYRQHEKELPSEATKAAYKERILRSYPFHPELIDALYLRWGGHPDFQRTRGVLRLLASVVGDLWERRQTETMSQPLIQPCHINWTIDAMQSALTRLWGATYQSVTAADVVGSRANAAQLDEERGQDYRRERIAQGLAAAILLGSFGGQAERAGYSSKDLKLACSRPGLNWSYTDGALLALEERGFYLHTASAGPLGKRYWFGTKPTLNKLIVQYQQPLAAETFDTIIVEKLEQELWALKAGEPMWRVLVNPGTDLPEQKSLSLLILPPAVAWPDNGGRELIEQKVLDLSRKCGAKERNYRNTLVFLLPSARGLNRLRQTLREEAALESVQRDYRSQLDDEQAEDLTGRLKVARTAAKEALSSAYTVAAHVNGQQLAIFPLTDAKKDFNDHLTLVWKQLVEEEEWILKKVGSVTLQNAGIIPIEGGMRLSDAVEAFLRYTDKPMIASREAVTQGLSQACKDKLIGIGRGLRVNNLQTRIIGQALVLDPAEDGVWILPPFTEAPPPTETVGTAGGPGTSSLNVSSEGQDVAGSQTATPATTTAASADKTIKKITISGAVAIEHWADVFRSFVGPAARMKLKRLRLGIQFELEAPDDQPLREDDNAVKAMREAARQLGVTIKDE